ncbi:amino acid adenylation domain-containing protein [Planomonospora sp. ID67723]|uniref:non-ribosomal peptide synthetase n=1 Tax=Planomonospora sp. ID67723 TaxID=2738134 RepID=UPI0018C38F9E|nr:non-ribosomal peptide synthetase [Planomonospora sp. ID67723]MBG0829763.1 amino acid adenylation domain-containing protein [Planomonospora sp. ID67723]
MRAPLSPAQERLWLLHRMDPDDASYIVFLVRRLHGPLDEGALRGALSDLVARHESLRTRFVEVDGVPWAVAEPAGPPGSPGSSSSPDALRSPDAPGPPGPLSLERLAADGPEEAERLVAERVNAPFDLAAGAPARVTLIRLSGDDHVLCFTLHHIVADGSSLNVLFDDLSACYTARVRGREPRLRPLPVQPSDYARWQRRRVERAVPYWQEKLADPPSPELPFDRLREDVRPGHGAFRHIRVDAAVTRELDRLARERRTTLFAVLMAAYQVLLFRHTGQEDVLVGTAVAGRDRVELEPLVGYVAQTVVLRGDLSGNPPFAELLGRTRNEALEALGRPGVPFERIDHPLGTLMPTMFILHNQNDGAFPPFGDLTVSGFADGYRQVKNDLLTEAWWDGDELIVSFCHDPGMVAPATIQRLASRFALLLESIAADPSVPIAELRIWTDDDHAAIRELAGDGAAAPGPMVPELIGAAVRLHPDAVAVVCGERSVTYGELHAGAERLAAVLRLRGVRRGDVVGVRLPRSVEAITALLAVWLAGAAYLPLDPDDPDERLVSSLENLARTGDGPAYLITTGGGPESAVVIGPAETAPAAEALETDPAETVESDPADAAYVISTSGSTGAPKGVLVEHRGVAARVRWMRREYGLAPGDRVVQFASLSFDAHVEEVFPTLAAGAALVLLPDGAATLPDLLASPAGSGVTVLDLPTAYWHRMVEEMEAIAWPPALRLVILGGEQVASAAVGRWRARFGDGVRLVNTYGPTETTVIATAADLGPGAATGRVPIGVPVGAASVRVLDARGEPVPPGAVGELVVGGAGVARGYLGRPALTAAAFVPDPYGPPGARRYRTGDRARWRADGRLEFLGRFDDQVKVRGFRIEPGEVESHLLAHPAVGQAHVAARGDDLVAYVTGTASPDELRVHLGGSLPRHLVPTLWVHLDELPLTTRGKIDRAALPDPGRVSAARAAHVPPRTDAERLVAAIWSEQLGVTAVGALDDFFSLGGHSLLATRIAARLRAGTGLEVPIRMVFAHRTVAALAAAVEDLLVEELSGLTDEEAVALLGRVP